MSETKPETDEEITQKLEKIVATVEDDFNSKLDDKSWAIAMGVARLTYKKHNAELLEKVRELRMYLSNEYGCGYMSAIGNVEKLLSPKQEKEG
jgi:hypothetical protein